MRELNMPLSVHTYAELTVFYLAEINELEYFMVQYFTLK